MGCSHTHPQNSYPPKSPTTPLPATSPTLPHSDWKIIKGNGVELSLPESYTGGNPSKDLDAIAQKLKTIDPEYEKRIESLKANSTAIALLAFDMQSAKSKFLTNVNVTTEKVPSGTTVEQYLDAAVKEMPSDVQVVDQKVVSLEKYQAGRVVAQSTAGGTLIKQLFYFIQNGNNFWLVTYSTAASEFDRRLPNFEESLRTFTPKS
ncbi:MAG: hypothetical protein NVSMB70_14600 [Chamaesiphon sp.]